MKYKLLVLVLGLLIVVLLDTKNASDLGRSGQRYFHLH